MSYILDALRRADQERQLTQTGVPDLHIHHETGEAPGPRRWWPVVGLVLLLNAAVAWYLFASPDAADAKSPSNPRSAVPAAVIARPPPAETMEAPPAPGAPRTSAGQSTGIPSAGGEAAPADMATTSAAEAPPVEVRTEPPRDEVASSPTPVTGDATRTVTTDTARQAPRRLPGLVLPPLPAVAAEAPAPPAARTAPTVKGAASTPRMIDNAALGPAAPRPEPDPVPEWRELDRNVRAGIDRPRLDVHVYDVTAEKRMVMIGFKRYREGDVLPSGLILEAIDADGARFAQDGVRFRVPRR